MDKNENDGYEKYLQNKNILLENKTVSIAKRNGAIESSENIEDVIHSLFENSDDYRGKKVTK
jgi:hypothetical protein